MKRLHCFQSHIRMFQICVNFSHMRFMLYRCFFRTYAECRVWSFFNRHLCVKHGDLIRIRDRFYILFRRFVWNFFRLEVEQLANYQKLHSSLLAVEVDSSSSSSANHSGDSSSSEDDEISVRQLRRHSELLHQHEQLLEAQRQRLKEEQQIRQHRISAAVGIFRYSLFPFFFQQFLGA